MGSDDHSAASPRRPEYVPDDQAWFWTDEWQAGERQVDEDIAAGRGVYFDSDEEFLAWLRSLTQQSAPSARDVLAHDIFRNP